MEALKENEKKKLSKDNTLTFFLSTSPLTD